MEGFLLQCRWYHPRFCEISIALAAEMTSHERADRVHALEINLQKDT